MPHVKVLLLETGERRWQEPCLCCTGLVLLLKESETTCTRLRGEVPAGPDSASLSDELEASVGVLMSSVKFHLK